MQLERMLRKARAKTAGIAKLQTFPRQERGKGGVAPRIGGRGRVWGPKSPDFGSLCRPDDTHGGAGTVSLCQEIGQQQKRAQGES